MAKTKSKTRRKKQAAKKTKLSPAARRLLKEADALEAQRDERKAELDKLDKQYRHLRTEQDKLVGRCADIRNQLFAREHMLPIFQALKGWTTGKNGMIQIVLPVSTVSPLLSLAPKSHWDYNGSSFSLSGEGGCIRFEWSKSTQLGACGASQEVICICAHCGISGGIVRMLKKFKLPLLLKAVVANHKQWLKNTMEQSALMLKGKDA